MERLRRVLRHVRTTGAADNARLHQVMDRPREGAAALLPTTHLLQPQPPHTRPAVDSWRGRMGECIRPHLQLAQPYAYLGADAVWLWYSGTADQPTASGRSLVGRR